MAHTGVALGFDDCLCHYLGGLIPSEVGKAGLSIPDSQLAARAARAVADGAPALPRGRICDGYGLQLETACLPGGHINERSCAIRDFVAGDLPGASTEHGDEGPLRSHVLPRRPCSTGRVRAWCQTSPLPRARASERRRRARRLRRGRTS